MRLRVLRSAWGMRLHDGVRALEPARVLDGVVGSGFDGLEASLDDLGARADPARGAAWMRAASERELTLVLSAYSSWRDYGSGAGSYDSDKPTEAHMEQLLADLRTIADLHHGTALSPLAAVNAHTGSDSWSDAQGARFFETLGEQTRELGLPCLAHETHRGRFLASPFVAARLLAAVPSVRLTSDFSHWVLAAERLLDSPAEAELLRRRIARACDHIHARLGTPQSAQLSDVDAPSGARAAERFYSWWEQIWTEKEAAALSSRDSCVTATVEYGPPETDASGESVGYAPSSAAGGAAAGAWLDAAVTRAAARLRERFERWHRQAVWRRLEGGE
ncbi:hypothetical protein KFE25_002967 [Diacronema lutheri]|uniref:Xylose isomerase-like TIM barrel domain-containing protein n=2 Tax=Diacronema lutheri TaxID=2081491 RepID=A0A8J5XPL1_DIALT|nr:hypothetical protein KFE25_002967 [Diacronema lutheri]